MEEILVSIWCITYNHELYIRDALEGFLAQKTNFTFEIIVHDDASTDETAKIVKEYENKYSGIIHGIYQDENQSQKNYPNIEWLLKIQKQNCRGKYIAECEGDDYWIDSNKLQMQIDYLEKHPECTMTFHNYLVWDCKNNKMWPQMLNCCEGVIPDNQLIRQQVKVPTASRVYRRRIMEMEEVWWKNVGIGDYALLLYSLTQGSVYYFDRVMSVYRFCHEGSWSLSLQNKEFDLFHRIRIIDFLKKFNIYTEYKYEKACISATQEYVDGAIAIIRELGWPMGVLYQKGKDYVGILQELKRLMRQLSDETYLDENIISFLNKRLKIIIMGAGKYAGILAQQLINNNIDFEGFAVSEGQYKENTYFNKHVWEMGSLPFSSRNIGVIVGINPVKWEEIIEALEQTEVNEYICPFLLR